MDQAIHGRKEDFNDDGQPAGIAKPGKALVSSTEPGRKIQYLEAAADEARDSNLPTVGKLQMATGGSSLSGLRRSFEPGQSSDAASQALAPTDNSRPLGKAPEETAEEEAGDEHEGLETEWDDVAARTEKMAAESVANRGSVVPVVEDPSFQNISWKEVHDWVLDLQVDRELLKIYDEEDEGRSTGCGCFSGGGRRKKGDVPGLDKRFVWEKDLVLFLKMTHFDFNNVTHFRMLRTIYVKLTRLKSCPWIGGHWETIGFQGGDPKTDLNRSGGVLNVIHLFYFLTHHFEILKSIWLLSRTEDQNFPLFAVSIGITKMIIEALFAGHLSQLCNKGAAAAKGNGGLFETLCLLHTAALFLFYWQWRHQKRTIRDTSVTYGEVEAGLKRPVQLLQKFHQAVADDKSRHDPSKLQFTDLELGTAGSSSRSAAPKQTGSSVPKRLRNYASTDDV